VNRATALVAPARSPTSTPPSGPTPIGGIPSMPAPGRQTAGSVLRRFWVLLVVAGVIGIFGIVHVIKQHIPSSTADVCSAFSTLSQKVNDDSGVFSNPVFTAVGNLANVASRYPDSQAVKDEAPELQSIADSNSTNVLAISSASTSIASLCNQSAIGLSLGNSG
jgi:hypothetical protein